LHEHELVSSGTCPVVQSYAAGCQKNIFLSFLKNI